MISGFRSRVRLVSRGLLSCLCSSAACASAEMIESCLPVRLRSPFYVSRTPSLTFRCKTLVTQLSYLLWLARV